MSVSTLEAKCSLPVKRSNTGLIPPEGEAKIETFDLPDEEIGPVEVKISNIAPKSTVQTKDSDSIQAATPTQDPGHGKPTVYEYEFYFMSFTSHLIIHLLFFFGFGPLFPILTPCIGVTRMRNLGFLGCKYWYFVQNFQAIVILYCLYYYFLNRNDTVVEIIEIVIMILVITIRCIFIATKYGYASQAYIYQHKNTEMTELQIDKQHLLKNWKVQESQLVKEELQQSLMRLDIDTSMFYFQFLNGIDENLENELKYDKARFKKEIQKRVSRTLTTIGVSPGKPNLRQKFPSLELINNNDAGGNVELGKIESMLEMSNNRFQDEGQRLTICFEKMVLAKTKFHDKKLFGYNLALNILEQSKKYRFQRIMPIALIIGLGRAILPILNRTSNDKPPFGNDLREILCIVSLIIINLYYFAANIAVVSQVMSDLSAKNYMMSQLSYLISLKLAQNAYDRAYPSFNVFDSVSLKTWESLRMVLLDYGRKFIVRNDVNLSIFFIIYLILFSIVSLEAIGIIKAFNNGLVGLILSYESIAVMLVFFIVLILGARVNEHFSTHKSMLKKIKTVLKDLKNLREHYFNLDNHSIRVNPEIFLYQEGINKLQEECREGDSGSSSSSGVDQFEERLVGKCDKLLEIVDDIIESLEYEEKNNPFTIMGITASYTFIKSAFAGLISILVFLFESKINS